MAITNTDRALNYLPYAMGAYGNGPGTNGLNVGNAHPVALEGFKPTPGSSFQGSLYKDPVTGKYTVAFAGTNDPTDLLSPDRVLATANLVTSVGAGAWDPQMTDAIKFTFEAFKQIKSDYMAANDGQAPTLDQIRTIFSATGHSLGGSLAELVSQFFGLRGANVDGPGVTALIGQPEYNALQAEVRKEFPELQSNYNVDGSQFSAFAYTVVGAAGTHVSGIEVQMTPEAAAAEMVMQTLGLNVGSPLPSDKVQAIGELMSATGSIVNHASAVILAETERLAGIAPQGAPPVNPYSMVQLSGAVGGDGSGSTTLARLSLNAVTDTVETNVRNGLSPTGAPLEGGAYRYGNFSVSAYRDAETGRIVEVFVPVNEQGEAIGSPLRREYLVDQNGRVGELDTDGNLRFVVRGVDGQAGGVITVAPDGQVRVQTVSGEAQTYSLANDGPPKMPSNGENWVDTIFDQLPINRILDAEPQAPFPVGSPVSQVVVEIDGQTYTYTSLGTLERSLPGQPGWTESRDSTGGGIIRDADGNVVAQLQAGDSVGMTDDGRISITNEQGQSVDRVVDQMAAGEFLLPTTPDLPPPLTGNYNEYLDGSGLSTSQQQALGQWLDGAGVGGVDNVGFVPLPGGGTVLLQNADGDIVGEITVGANGVTQVRGIDGEPTYITSEGQTLSAEQYVQQQEQQQAAQNASTALGLLQNLIGLENWDQMSDGQKAAVLVGMYNAVDGLSGNALPGNLSGVTSVLGLLNALDGGDFGSILYSGLALDQALSAAGQAFTNDIATSLGFESSAGGNVLPMLGFVLALDSGDPVSIASSGMALLGALNLVPGGQVIGLFISVIGMMRDPPLVQGQASLGWNDQGELVVQVDSSRHGGGEIAAQYVGQLGLGLDAQLQAQQAEQGIPTEDQVALNPERMPEVGYESQYGTSLSLSWTDENGQTQTRYYDQNGRHPSGSTMAQDYVQMVAQGGAVVPAWLVQGAQSQYSELSTQASELEAQIEALQQQAQALGPQTIQHSGGEGGWEETVPAADPKAYAQVQAEIAQLTDAAQALRQEAQAVLQEMPRTQDLYQQGQLSEDGLSQTLSVITLEMPGMEAGEGERSALLNLDADAYLEQSQWVSANQAVMGIDLSGNGQLEANELLHGDLGWLDSNGDGRIDASDPAFGAIKLWLDINGDGQSQGETQSLAQAGISAIVITAEGMHIERADGSTQTLGEQDLTGDTLGVIYSTHEDAAGLLQTTEQADGTGETVLLAANTREFDGQAEHTHGGEVVWGDVAQEVHMGVGDANLTSSTFYSADSASTQTHVVLGQGDANWQEGQAGQVLSGQVSGVQTHAVMGADAVQGEAGPNTQATQVWTTDDGQRVVSQAPAEAPTPQAQDWHVVDVEAEAAIPEEPFVPLPVPEGSTTVLSGQTSGEQTTLNVAASALADGAAGEVLAGQAAGGMPAQALTPGDVTDNGQVFQSQGESDGSGPSATSVVEAGDIRITSAPAPATSIERQRVPVVFVPSGASGLTDSWQRVTAEMLRSASVGILSGDGAPLMALAVGVGTSAILPTAQAAEGEILGAATSSTTTTTTLQDMGWMGLVAPDGQGGAVVGTDSALSPSGAQAGATVRVGETSAATTVEASGQTAAAGSGMPISWMHLSVHDATGAGTSAGASATTPSAATDGADSTGSPMGTESGLLPQAPTGISAWSVSAMHQNAPVAPALADLQLRGVEDTGLLLDAGYLFAMGQGGDGLGGTGLKLQAVGTPQHGRVALQSEVGADGQLVQRVVFVPDADHFGEAGFSFVVVNAWGLEQTVQVHLSVDATDDAPRVLGESLLATEDRGLVFAQELLLANDLDPDVPGDNASLRITRVAGAVHGQVWLGSDGQVYFEPEANYAGPAQFTYWVSNGSGLESAAQVQMDLQPVNDAPIAVGERVQGLEDQALLFSQAALLANDLDADSPAEALRIVAVGQATHGTVELLANGQVLFTPAENYFGPASFDYTVADEWGATSSTTVHVTLAPVNDAPTVRGEDLAGVEDTPMWLDAGLLLANDSDVDNPASSLRITWVGNAVNGVVSLGDDGRIQFVPNANFNLDTGVATFSYTVSDGAGGQTTGVAQVLLAPVNDAPIAVGERMDDVPEDTALVFSAQDLLANDSDVDVSTSGQVLRISAVGDAEHGVVTLRDDGSVVFQPDPDYFGPARFSYVVDDGAGGQAQAWMDMTFTSVNDAPLAQPDTVAGTEDQAQVVRVADLLANDSDVDGPQSALRLVWVGDAVHGDVTQLPNGDIQFVPAPNFEGTASFQYRVEDGEGGVTETTVLVQVAAVNDLPVAADDVLPTQWEDVPLIITANRLLGNDADVDVQTSGQVLRIASVEAVAGQTHGGVSLDADGSVRFVPDAHYAGPVRFAYTVDDGAGGVARAEVSFELLNVNDAPVVAGELLVAKNQSELFIDPATLLANDWDVDTPYTGDVLTVLGVEGAQNGTVTLLADGRIHFVFDPGFSGVGRFDYVVDDGRGGQSVATAEVSNVNLAPVVLGETITLQEDVVAHIDAALLLANDSDPDNLASELRILSVGNATHGSVTMDAQGAIVFTPDPDYFGTAQFTYTVGDGEGGLTVGTASLNIQAVNDAPTVTGEQMQTLEDQVLHMSVADLLANDSDIDGPGPLGIVAVGNAHGGTVALSGGSVVFTPYLNFNGSASFTYTVSDGAGGYSQARVDVQIAPVNDAPVANNENVQGFQEQTFTISAAALLANDVDMETPGYLSLVQVMNAQHGVVSLSGGVVTFVPEPGYYGVASFSYVIADPEGLTSVGTTTLDLKRLNLTPVAVDDSFSGLEDVPFVISAAQLLANDSDDMGVSNLDITAVRAGVHGSVTLMADGSVRFTPDSNYNGPAQFQYQVTDADGASTWATAYLTVASVNDAPEIEAVWQGAPIYGYQFTWAGDGVPHWDFERAYWDVAIKPIYSESEAVTLGSDLWSMAGTTITPNYLPHSGAMVPIAFEQNDGGFFELDPFRPLDDLSQDSGRVVTYDLDSAGGLTYQVIHSLSTHGGASVDSSGNWHYASNALDPYYGSDSFVIRVTDSGGAFKDVTINTYHAGKEYVPPKTGNDFAPVAIDLGGDGLELLSPSESAVVVDVDGDGVDERVGWVGANDAVLVYDANRDDQVDIATEVSFVKYLLGAQTDLEGLRAFDSNGNGFLDAGDEQWQDFGIWQDANGSGVQDEGEFVRLDDAGIVSLSLVRTGTPEEINGNIVVGTSSVQLNDGSVVMASDVLFGVIEDAAHQVEGELASVEATLPADALLVAADVHDGAAAEVTTDVKDSVDLAIETTALNQESELLAETSEVTDSVAVSGMDETVPAELTTVAMEVAADDPLLPTDAPATGADLASEVEVIRMAQLFNEWSNVDVGDTEPLAFVPSAEAVWGTVLSDDHTVQVANAEHADQVLANGSTG